MSTGRSHPRMKLMSLLESDDLTVIAGAHDALSAKLAEREGFDAVWVSSLGVTSALGMVDEGILTMTEMLDAAWRIRRAISCPVVVDCDTGYGEIPNVRRLVFEAVSRDIDGLCLEDQLFPKRNTFLDGEHQLEDAHRFGAKIAAAVDARDSVGGECLIIARTEALAQGHTVEAAVDRARLYAAAGADAILVQHREPQLGALAEFAAQRPGGKAIGILATSIRGTGFDELGKVGFGFAIYANQGLRAAVQATSDTYRYILSSGGRQPEDLRLASMADVLELQSDWRT